MSAECPPGSPCRPLWELLRLQYQQDWCAGCPDDIACRIPGWPVLNATAACAVVPHEYLFSSATANEACCIADDEPFRLADWVGAMCNGSEWRAPFAYYGGMAREDWEQWIEAWNWTVERRPPAGPNETYACASNYDILWSFGIEDFLHFAFALVLSFIGYLKVRKGIDFSGNIKWERVAFAGVVETASWVGSALINAAQIVATPSYQDVPYGELVSLLFARPCPLGLPCIISLAIPRLEIGSVSSAEANRTQGRQVLAKIVATYALAQGFVLLLAARYPILTVIAARYRGFYPVSNLTPYWRGHSAALMYAGGLTWTVFFPFVAIFLLVVSFSHLLKVRLEFYNINNEELDWLLKRLLPYYRTRQTEARQQQDEENAKLTEDENAASSRRNLLSAIQQVVPRFLHDLLLSSTVYYHNAQVEELVRRRTIQEARRRDIDQRDIDYEVLQRSVQAQEDRQRFWRPIVAALAFVLCAIVYIAQWVFWAGFVEVKDPRYVHWKRRSGYSAWID